MRLYEEKQQRVNEGFDAPLPMVKQYHNARCMRGRGWHSAQDVGPTRGVARRSWLTNEIITITNGRFSCLATLTSRMGVGSEGEGQLSSLTCRAISRVHVWRVRGVVASRFRTRFSGLNALVKQPGCSRERVTSNGGRVGFGNFLSRTKGPLFSRGRRCGERLPVYLSLIFTFDIYISSSNTPLH